MYIPAIKPSNGKAKPEDLDLIRTLISSIMNNDGDTEGSVAATLTGKIDAKELDNSVALLVEAAISAEDNMDALDFLNDALTLMTA